MTLLLLDSLLVTALALLLARRVERAEDEVARILPACGPGAGFAAALRTLLLDTLSRRLLLPARGRGLADLPLPVREAHDSCRDAASLVRHLADHADAAGLACLESQVKALYELQAALALDEDELAPCLDILMARLQATPFLDVPIGRVETIPRGALVDRRTMWPLNSGTRVQQPLGVLLRAPDGRILSRPRVWCR